MIFQMKESTKMHIAVQISQALLFLHTATPTMIHLDVKPSNILVSGKREYNGLLFLLVMPTFCVFYRLSSHHTIPISEILGCQR